MLERLLERCVAVVPASARRFVRPVAPIAVVAVLFALIGLAWPLSGSSSASGASSSAVVPANTSADAGRIDGFLAMARWGRPAYDAEAARRAAESAEAAARAAAEGKGLNPELARLGVIGISSAAGSHAVLLTRPDGALKRLTDGEALPDGRVLVSVTANALVLEDADGGREELLLFPRLGGATDVVEPPTAGEALP